MALNFSYWGAIGAEFMDDESYDVDFVGKGKKYYQDFNIEVKNRWNKRLSSTITFLDLSIDKGVSLEDRLVLMVILMLKLVFLNLMLKMAKTEIIDLFYSICGPRKIEKNGWVLSMK